MHRILICTILMGAFACAGCQRDLGPNPWDGKAGPRVLVTFPPLYSFVCEVAGPDAHVVSMLTNQGPHDYEGGEIESRLMARAELVFMIGLGLDEAIVEKLSKSSGSKAAIIGLGDAIDEGTLREMEGGHDHGHAHNHAHAGHNHGSLDPHVWLGIPQAIQMVTTIAKELGKIDPAHQAGYQERAKAFIARLQALQSEGKAMLKEKKERSFVTFHDSLQYFADSYDLKIAGVIQVDPGVEPSRAQMNQVIEMCRKNNVRLIAVEPQFSANSAAKSVLDALKQSGMADAAFVEVDPLETCDPSQLTASFYETKVRQNLTNLAKALK